MSTRAGTTPTSLASGETVPLRERLRLTQYLRVAAMLLVLTAAVLAPDTL